MKTHCIRCKEKIEEGQKVHTFSPAGGRIDYRMHLTCWKDAVEDMDRVMALFPEKPKQVQDPTKCKNGHEREGNTFISSQGYKVCRICYKDGQERAKAKQRRNKRYGAIY